MAKAPKRAFVCNECGADYPRWQGQCSACHAWNTITEVRGVAASPGVARNERLSGYAGNAGVAKVQKLSDISLEELPRFSTGFKEFDRVLGGGVVPGSAILIGGNPGAGKSTLLLQTLCKLAEQMKTLYVTGEESLQQVAMRAHRLGLPTANLNMLSETSIEQICLIAEEEQPKLMVIDSIQVMHMADIQSSPGSVAQVRETAAYLTRFAKTRGVAIVMVGHVTKDGSLAGPKVLEHCIDCSVLLDGDADSRFRTLRSHKNRFGAVNELVQYESGQVNQIGLATQERVNQTLMVVASVSALALLFALQQLYGGICSHYAFLKNHPCSRCHRGAQTGMAKTLFPAAQRQRQCKFRALTSSIAHAHAPAVPLGNLVHNGKAKPCSTSFL